nr:PcfJ domain-containing protein [uncultured Oscillibacter sp.]
MEKCELLAMRKLYATSRMISVAKQDTPKKVKFNTYWGPREEIRRKYWLYMRSCIENGILKVSLFYPDNLRVNGRQPSYEVYIDRNAGRFITYDRINNKWSKAKVDRLEWPRMPHTFDVWVSNADSKMVASYLNSIDEKGYKAILSYQKKLREEARIRQYQKETNAWDADMALTPALPKDWDRWVSKVGIPQNYIFYEYRSGGARTGYCTYCEKDVPIKGKPLHNKTGRCPCCRHEITYKAIGKLGWRTDTEEVCIYLIQPRPDGFVVREFWAGKRYLKENLKTPKIYCVEHWRTIYTTDLVRRFYYWGTYKQFSTRWIAGSPSYSPMGANCIYNTHGDKPGRVYGKTLPHLNPILKHTGLLEWIYGHHMIANPDSYFKVRKQIPQLEQMWKAELFRLADECECNSDCMYDLMKAPQSTSLSKALGLDKQRLERLRRSNGGTDLLYWLQIEKQGGKPIPDEVLNWFCKQDISRDCLDFIWDKMTAVQIYNYLRRQVEESQEPIQQVLTTWRDYLSMAERLGIDTSDEIIYRVKLLRQRHDELVLRCKQMDKKKQAAEVLKHFPKVDRICQAIKAKYEYANEEYIVIAPNGVLDIIVEGDILCHCLRGADRYWDRIQTHESYILFLRRASNPDMPYYTLEIEPDGTIRQKRTKFDRQEPDIEDAKKFLVEWQRVVAKRLNKDDRKKAAASRVLREQEFDQMRRDNVIIYTGDLAGQRLVDVLTADLMETAA